MSHVVWFQVSLQCLTTQRLIVADATGLYTSSFTPEPGDIGARIGDVLPLALEDFEDAFLTLKQPAEDIPVVALELWECRGCEREHWVRLEFERLEPARHRLIAAETASLSFDLVEGAHYVSRSLDRWLNGLEVSEIEPGLIRILTDAVSDAPRGGPDGTDGLGAGA